MSTNKELSPAKQRQLANAQASAQRNRAAKAAHEPKKVAWAILVLRAAIEAGTATPDQLHQ